MFSPLHLFPDTENQESIKNYENAVSEFTDQVRITTSTQEELVCAMANILECDTHKVDTLLKRESDARKLIMQHLLSEPMANFMNSSAEKKQKNKKSQVKEFRAAFSMLCKAVVKNLNDDEGGDIPKPYRKNLLNNDGEVLFNAAFCNESSVKLSGEEKKFLASHFNELLGVSRFSYLDYYICCQDEKISTTMKVVETRRKLLSAFKESIKLVMKNLMSKAKKVRVLISPFA